MKSTDGTVTQIYNRFYAKYSRLSAQSIETDLIAKKKKHNEPLNYLHNVIWQNYWIDMATLLLFISRD